MTDKTPSKKPAPAKKQKAATKKSKPQTEKQKAAAKAREGRAKQRAAQKKIPPEDRPLDNREKVFVDEYLTTMSPRIAALNAGYSAAIATSKAYWWARNGRDKPHVYKAIQKRLDERSRKLRVTQEMVLKRFWDIATADPNELVQYRRVNCRNCNGKGHAYQWIDEAEYKRACDREEEQAEKDERTPHLPSCTGGFGYNEHADPHPDCPECNGDGMGRVHVADTRMLSEQAQALYAGMKVTKEGIEVKMHDQNKNLENVARHLGMFKDLGNSNDPENPLATLISAISGNTLCPKDGDDGEGE